MAFRKRGLFVGGSPSGVFLGTTRLGQAGGTTAATSQITIGFSNQSQPSAGRAIVGIISSSASRDLVSMSIFGNSAPLRGSVRTGVAGLYLFSAWCPHNETPRAVLNSNPPISLLATYSGALSSDPFCWLWAVTGLGSLVPDVATSTTTVDTTRTVDLRTQPGGFLIAASANDVTAANSMTWSGDQTPTERYDATTFAAFSAADISNTNDDAANTVTATYAVVSIAYCSLIAGAFR